MATSNAAPTANNDSAALTATAGAQVTGNVLTNDTDPEQDPLRVSAVNGQAAAVGSTIAGTYGSLVLGADGLYTYVVASNQANVQALAPGQTVTEVFHYTLSDGFDHATNTTSVTNQNLVTQSEAFDNAAWGKFFGSGSAPSVVANVAAGPLGGAATADQLTLSGAYRGLYFNTAASGTYTFSVWVRLISGDGRIGLNYYDGGSGNQLQTFTATSSWQRVSVTFSGTGSSQANVAIGHDGSVSGTGTFQLWGAQLNAGSAPSDYLATSGTTAQTTSTSTTPTVVTADLTIAVTGAGGANAAPDATGDIARVGGGVLQATGDVLANDKDPEGDALTVAAVNGQAAKVGATIAGAYGSLVLGADGKFTYVANATAVQGIAPGQAATDSFTYTVSDGFGHAQVQSVISGENFIVQSEKFNDTTWGRFGSQQPTIVADVAAGPMGGAATADRITLSGASSGIYYQHALPGQYTFSVWVRLVSGDGNFALNYYDGGSSGTLKSFVASSTWQRYSLTVTGNGAAADNVAFMHSPTQSANGVFEVWGAQINPGASPSTYVPTTGHYDKVFTDVAAPAEVTATLNVVVAGPDPAAGSANTLNFAGGSEGVVVNLATGQWSQALKVLPLGDSITDGKTSPALPAGTEDGYRGPLWWSYAAESKLVNLVGPNTAGDIYLPDKSHAGTPGYRSDQIAAQLPGLLSSTHPDAILLMAGTNDIFEETSPTSHVVDSLKRMIDIVAGASPQTHLYVALLTPISPTLDPTDAAKVAGVNAAIRQTVADATAAGLNVSLVDTSSITAQDLADYAHLTSAGYEKLGLIWAQAIHDQVVTGGSNPLTQPHTIAAGVTKVVGSEDNDLLIANNAGDVLQGGGGADVIWSGGGNDTLTGGTGADMFVVSRGSGDTQITDFSQTQQDHLVLHNFAGLNSFSQLSGHVRVSGGSTIIDLSSFGSDTQIELANFTRSLTSADVWIG